MYKYNIIQHNSPVPQSETYTERYHIFNKIFSNNTLGEKAVNQLDNIVNIVSICWNYTRTIRQRLPHHCWKYSNDIV